MDRDRDRRDDRDRGRIERGVERRGDGGVTTMIGSGESYRPGPSARPRSPPRTDTYIARDRSPLRRERARSPVIDSWHPNTRDRSPPRRISRTPPRRDRSMDRDNWRRPRSPPRARSPPRRSTPRRFSPRRDDDRRARSPPRRLSPRRDERRRSRSPFDRRTPRVRSPARRSPPAGPRGGFRPRSNTPDRRPDIIHRRRSPSPAITRDSSGRTSGNNSRRSSPPIHPDRISHQIAQSVPREPAMRARSPPSRQRSPVPARPRSPAPARQRSPAPARQRSPAASSYRDSARSTPRERSPVRAVPAKSPPRGPAGFRPPPTGPSSIRNFSSPVPTRPRENSGVIPPAGPRGYIPPARGTFSSRGGRGSFGSDRISRPDTSSWGAAPSRAGPDLPIRRGSTSSSISAPRPAQSPSPVVPQGPSSSTTSIPTGPSSSIPTGPRAGIPSRTNPNLQHSSTIYNTLTKPHPNSLVDRTQPRPHPAMANLPLLIPGGRIDPSQSGLSIEAATRLKRKEEDEDALRLDLAMKEERLRAGLRGWQRLERESASMGLRSQLSEGHVRVLAGEGVGGAAF